MKTFLDQIKVTIHSASLKNIAADVWVIPVFKEEKLSGELAILDNHLNQEITKWLSQEYIKTDREKSSWMTIETKDFKTSNFLFLNLGSRKDFSKNQVRDAFGSASKSTNSRSFGKVGLIDLGIEELPIDVCIEGFLMGSYKFTQYKSEKNAIPTIKQLEVFSLNEKELKPKVQRLEKILRGTFLARDLVNEPANIINPMSFAKIAQDVAKKAGITIHIIKGAELKKENMNLIMAVAQGSANEPCLIHVEYKPTKKAKHTVALVGKGVTFDTGGLSLKPAAPMLGMKMDMAGAASVLGAVWAAAELELPVHVHAIMPMVENMPSDRAIRPGDVIRGRNGKTVEIDNTDAEGRLILADALNYAEDLKPDYMIDVATLTGACVIALGDEIAALYSTDSELNDRLEKASQDVGEKMWPMPMEKSYFSQMKSEIADFKNVGGREGGSITAALFLKEFVSKTKWAHLDIAGPSEAQKDWPTCAKGATGYPVRTFVTFLEQL